MDKPRVLKRRYFLRKNARTTVCEILATSRFNLDLFPLYDVSILKADNLKMIVQVELGLYMAIATV